VDATAFAGMTSLAAAGTADAVLFGGPAAGDTLSTSSSGNSILAGGSRNNTLTDTGTGSNILISGGGIDSLTGNGNDILIGGTTNYDANNSADIAALDAILAEWDSTDAYSTKIGKISSGVGAGGADALNLSTVQPDTLASNLSDGTASAENNWFVVGSFDKVTKQSNEIVTVLQLDGWQGYALNAQHTALSPTASQGLGLIAWQTPVDLNPQYSGNNLLIHYGSPVITAANTVLVPVKTGASGGFEIQAHSGSTGGLEWTATSDYVLPPDSGATAYDWLPSYGPTLAPSNVLYFPGDGGTVEYITTPDAGGPATPAVGRLAFYGTSTYNANPSAYNSTIYINTPITSDNAGNIYFGYVVTGSNPSVPKSGIARISANGTGSFVAVQPGMAEVAENSAPALSNDGSTLYVLESTGNWGWGELVALNSTTLAVESSVSLYDPHNTTKYAVITNDGTASPTVGPDGDVYVGVLENPFASNNDRGWLLHFNANLSVEKTPGQFGWDDTASIVPASMVPSYHGSSTYLLMTKYNNYAGEGGTGINEIAILDPNATEIDSVTGTTVMKEVLTIAGPTPDPSYDSTHPGAVKEWCINSAVVDPATDCILATSEDGKLYRWNLATNTFTQSITLTSGLGEAYTPTLIGPDGTVYAISNATLFAIRARPLSFLGTNTTTEGNWKGVYGSQGYNIINNAVSYPSYATVSATGESNYTWASSTTATPALEDAVGNSRIAAAWYATSTFSINVNFTDGQTHDIALYALDYDNRGRQEQIQITNATTGSALDTETISSFATGVYLQWALSGDVVIKVTTIAGPNCVISGLFFDPPTTPPAPLDTLNVSGVPSSVTAGSTESITVVALTPIGGTDYNYRGTVAFSSSDPIAGLPPNYTFTAADNGVHTFNITLKTAGVQSIAATDTSNSVITGSESKITVAPAAASSLSVTGLPNPATTGTAFSFTVTAYDPYGNVATGYTGTIAFSSNDTKASLPGNFTFTSTSAGVQSFSATFNTAGTDTLTATDINTTTITGSASTTVNNPSGSTAAQFVRRDASTEGNWKGVYGSQGYNIINNAVSYPSYATVSVSGQSSYTWSSSTNATQALEDAVGTSRIAAAWYATTSFSINVNFTDGQTHDLALYALDYDNQGRKEQIQITNATTGAVLDTETISSFTTGIYLQWAISGNVVITATRLAGPNAVISGLFFDPPSAASDTLSVSGLPSPETAGTQETFTVTALTPGGTTDTNYTGTIHFTSTDPQAVLPANYLFTSANAGTATFTVTFKTAGAQSITATDTSNALITGSQSNINIAPAAASSLTVSLPSTATAGSPFNFTVTAYDQYGNVATGYTGTIMFTSSDGSASLPGNYMFTSTDAGIHQFQATLNSTGSQSITATDTVTSSITGSGSTTVATRSASATFIKSDTATEGNWMGVYGSKGYNVIGNAVSYPSYANVSVSGESNYTWASSTSATQALEDAVGNSRIAACWYSSNSFSINVDFTDGQTHDLALYLLDYDSKGRSEQIQITSAATGAVLSTQTVSSFTNGVYLQWAISGNVVITVTRTGGANAVVSGLFFD
jgi:hypothetical protein